jgi:hypothetical protein
MVPFVVMRAGAERRSPNPHTIAPLLNETVIHSSSQPLGKETTNGHKHTLKTIVSHLTSPYEQVPLPSHTNLSSSTPTKMLFCSSFFCNKNDHEVTKPSAFLYPNDDHAEAEDMVNMMMIQQQKADHDLLYPHLANLHQPRRGAAGPTGSEGDEEDREDDISISVESLFCGSSQPIPDQLEMEVEEIPLEMAATLPPPAVVPTPTSTTVTKWTEEHIDQVIHALRRADAEAAQADLAVDANHSKEDEEAAKPAISKEDFIAVLNRIEKENAWHEKRQAKKNKVVGKKNKNKRGNKNNGNKDKTKNKLGGGGLQQRSTNQNTMVVAPVRVPLQASSQN